MKKQEHTALALVCNTVIIASLCIVIMAFTGLPQGITSPDGKKPVNDLNKNGKLDVYEDSTQPVQERVKDLLKQMTLEEKVAQTQCKWLSKGQVFTKSQFDAEKAEKIMPDGLGHFARPNEGASPAFAGNTGWNARETAELTNTIQKYFIENTRLGIPVIFHEESLHGNQAKDATSFPSVLGMASSWNEDLFSEVYSNVAKEVRYRGAHQVLAPVVDLVIDPRWGRTDETMGEDPYLTSRLGLSVVKAYQGNSEKIDKDHVVATLKHFGVHGQPEGGCNTGPVFFSERHLRQTFLKPFQTCVEEGGVLGVMPAYPENSGVPSHADKWLLTELLRKEWGFRGIVVSDYSAIRELQTNHAVAANADEASILAITAGVDMELPDPYAYTQLTNLVKTGKIPVDVLDRTVSRILEIKFRLGLFDDPFVDPDKAESFVGNDQMRALALKAARQSLVLLKNDKNLLPLDRNQVKKIAIIGPQADQCVLGGYSGTPKQTVTPVQAIKEKYPEVNIVYAKGCDLVKQPKSFMAPPVAVPHEDNLKLIIEAIEVAKDADAILLMIGSNTLISNESVGKPYGLGDLSDLELFGDQNELVDSLSKLNIPMAAFVICGPPVSFAHLTEKADAIVQCWYLGQETGYAVAETIFGDNNPTGKLAISIPRSAGHIPAYYYYKPSARRGYNFSDVSPLYPFGFGLSYTTYEYKNLKISQPQINMNASAEVSIDVTNTGKTDGEEIVQLYIRDKVSSVTRPVKELKDFRRVAIRAGETKNVTFNVTPDKLKFFNLEMKEVVEPGEFEIMVGPSSNKIQKINLTVLN
jgi:beta-glucosidase